MYFLDESFQSSGIRFLSPIGVVGLDGDFVVCLWIAELKTMSGGEDMSRRNQSGSTFGFEHVSTARSYFQCHDPRMYSTLKKDPALKKSPKTMMTKKKLTLIL